VLELRDARVADLACWERDWKPRLLTAGHAGAGWPWQEHIERASTDAGRLCLAMARGDRVEALASLVFQPAESRLEPGAPIVYVEYVGTAPENQAPPIGSRAFRGLGGVLVREAVRLASQMGIDGRVGLHSKQEVEGFYEALGFTAVEREVTPDGKWLYFETDPQAARGMLGNA